MIHGRSRLEPSGGAAFQYQEGNGSTSVNVIQSCGSRLPFPIGTHTDDFDAFISPAGTEQTDSRKEADMTGFPEEMIRAQAMTARVACARMTVVRLAALRDTLERRCECAAKSQGDGRAPAHAGFCRVLADAADDQRLVESAASAHQLILAVGRAA